jgi:signal peptidase I
MDRKILGMAIVAIILILAAALVWQMHSQGISFKAVSSSSMEPAVPVGAVAVLSKADLSNLKAGDIIAFSSGNSTTIQRIIEVTPEGFRTKGDAEKEADPELIRKSEILGKVLFVVPDLGILGSFVRTPIGFAAMILIPAGLIILYEAITIKRLVDREQRGRKKEEVFYLGYKEPKHHETEGEKHAKFAHLRDNLEAEISNHRQNKHEEEPHRERKDGE